MSQDSQSAFLQMPIWAELLRKPVPSPPETAHVPSSVLQSRPPLTPQDKAGTSAKILLYDTYARLETFSERQDTLLKEVIEAKREMVNAREDMRAEQEKHREEVVQLGQCYRSYNV